MAASTISLAGALPVMRSVCSCIRTKYQRAQGFQLMKTWMQTAAMSAFHACKSLPDTRPACRLCHVERDLARDLALHTLSARV